MFMKKHVVLLLVCALLAAIVPVALYSLPDEEAAAAHDGSLPTVGSYENLKKLLKQTWKKQRYKYAAAEMAVSSAPQGAPAQDRGSADYSTTNVQVQGVDEADVVKTDGTYLYQATPQEVRIVKAHPAKQMAVVSRLSYKGTQFEPRELYVDDKHLVVIGHSGHDRFNYDKSVVGYHLQTSVKAMVYDLSDKSNPRLTREVELEGHYLSSRKIGSHLYLVSNKYIDVYPMLEQEIAEPAPVYRDNAQGGGYQAVSYADIRYFPEQIQPDYLMVAGVHLDNPKQKLSVNTYLGAGENIYASLENLYVAVTQEENPSFQEKIGAIVDIAPVTPLKANTTLYRFALKDGSVTYTGKGTVPGRVLNQFSMDEHKGYLRIATTSGEMWRNDEHTSKNNLYMLDGQLKIAGKLEGVAPGERIYSVRFMGDRAYMVTFKKVDPLFVIDVKNPRQPQILGALKIPGYSDYLHPYDENHLIGFGKAAVEDKEWAYYQGMKMALFDVTDVNRPKETFKLIIGDRGTDSELLYNHKALLFSKERQLLAFPVTIRELDEQQKQRPDAREYGHFRFQGALVYKLDIKTGFTLLGNITHLTEEDMKKAGDDWYDSEKNVQRILYVGDTLYTVSQSYVKAHQLATLRELRTLSLKE
jgi:uncharacterized secreted protein with C-terminal beta-propeller domain